MKQCQKYSGIGGQAILEGIMMKNRQNYACAVRKPDGEIALMKETYVSMPEEYPVLSLPLIRGVFSFADSLILGMRALNWSAEIYADGVEEEEEPSRFEKWLTDTLGEKAESVVMGIVMAFSFVAAICIFMLLPMFLSTLLRKVIDSHYVVALLEGVLRIAIFVTYIKLISRMEDIRRTFMYHGAEHKSIFCYEAGKELTVENVRAMRRYHPRCGTSFLILMVLVSIFISFFIDPISIAISGQVLPTLWRVLVRILLIPLIVGIGYELIKFAGRHDNFLTRVISAPGVWLQHITVREPEDGMIECAIEALKAVIPEDGSDHI